MPDYRTMYDRDYIGHFVLPGGKDMTLTIKRVVGGELTAMGGRKSKKPIVHFAQDKVKPMICNKTNARTIAAMYGNMVEAWKEKNITLFVSTTRDPSGGGEVECIRVRPTVPNAPARTPVASEPQDLEEIHESAAGATTHAAHPAQPTATLPAAPDAAAPTFISDAKLRALVSVVEQKGIKARFSTKLASNKIASADLIPSHLVSAFEKWAEEAQAVSK